MREFRGRKSKIELKKIIDKLVIDGLSFQDIANTLNLKSRQLARYHWKTLRQTKVAESANSEKKEN